MKVRSTCGLWRGCGSQLEVAGREGVQAGGSRGAWAGLRGGAGGVCAPEERKVCAQVGREGDLTSRGTGEKPGVAGARGQ